MLFEYSLLTDKKEVEPLTDFLMDRGAYSVSIEDADAETEREKPIFGEPGIEIDDFVADCENAIIEEQVTNGIAVRMAVFSLLCGKTLEDINKEK